MSATAPLQMVLLNLHMRNAAPVEEFSNFLYLDLLTVTYFLDTLLLLTNRLPQGTIHLRSVEKLLAYRNMDYRVSRSNTHGGNLYYSENAARRSSITQGSVDGYLCRSSPILMQKVPGLFFFVWNPTTILCHTPSH